MFRSKRDVDKMVQDAMKKSKDKNTASVRGLYFGKLYREVGDYESARKYLEDFLKIKTSSSEAYVVYGEILETLGHYPEALKSYKKAYEIDEGYGRDSKILMKICSLTSKHAEEDSEFWIQKASLLHPSNPLVSTAKRNLLLQSGNGGNWKTLFLKSPESSFKDCDSQIDILQTLMVKEDVSEIFSVVQEYEKNYPWPKSYKWYKYIHEICEIYAQRYPSNLNSKYYFFEIHVLEHLIENLIIQETNSDAFNSTNSTDITSYLWMLDCSFGKAIRNLSINKHLKLLIKHYEAQLFLLMARCILRRSKMEGCWDKYCSVAAFLYSASYNNVKLSEYNESWYIAMEKDYIEPQIIWDRASYRLSESGHMIMNIVGSEESNLLNQVYKMYNNDAGKQKILEDIYKSPAIRSQSNKSWFCNHETFPESLISLPTLDDLKDNDGFLSKSFPSDLHSIVWLCRHYCSSDMKFQPEYPFSFFDSLPDSSSLWKSSSIESLSHLDTESFLYASVWCSYNMYKFVSRLNKTYPPCLTKSLSSDLCKDWWVKVYNLCNSIHKDQIGDQRRDVQRGIEAIRGVEVNGLHVELLAHLGRTFAERAATFNDIQEDLAPSDNLLYLQRSAMYWEKAVDVLDKLATYEHMPVPRMQYFKSNLPHPSMDRILELREEGQFSLACLALKSNNKEKALKGFSTVNLPLASYYKGLILKQMAEDVSSSKLPDSFEEKYLLTQAKEAFLQSVDQLKKSQDDKRHPMTHILYSRIQDIDHSLLKLENIVLPESSPSIYTATPIKMMVKSSSPIKAVTDFQSPVKDKGKDILASTLKAFNSAQESMMKILKDQNEAMISCLNDNNLVLKENNACISAIKDKLDEVIKVIIEGRDYRKAPGEYENDCYYYGDMSEVGYDDEGHFTQVPATQSNLSNTSFKSPFSSMVPSNQDSKPQLFGIPQLPVKNEFGSPLAFGQFTGGKPLFSDTATVAVNFPVISAMNPSTIQDVGLTSSHIYSMAGLNGDTVTTCSSVIFPKSPIAGLTSTSITSPPHSYQIALPTQAKTVDVSPLDNLKANFGTVSSKFISEANSDQGNRIISTPVIKSEESFVEKIDSVVDTKTTSILSLGQVSSTATRGGFTFIGKPSFNTVVSSPPVTTSTVKSSPFANFTFGSLSNVPSSFSFGSDSPSAFQIGSFSVGASLNSSSITPKPIKLENKSLIKSPKQEDDVEQHEDFEPNLDFKPVVSLPEVQIQTGEEDEVELFCKPAKLFRFVQATKEWKERGIGNIKILKSKSGDKARIVMRRDQVLKLCANHYINPDMTMKPKDNSKKTFVWIANDYSDGTLNLETLTVRFKDEEHAREFHKVFVDVQNEIKANNSEHKASSSDSETIGSSNQSSSTNNSKSLSEQFKPPEGSWDCPTCYVNNAASSLACIACECLKEPNVVPKNVESDKTSFASFKPAQGSWDCSTCYVNNSSSASECIACQSQRDGVAKTSSTSSSTPKFHFGIPNNVSNGTSSTSVTESKPASGFVFGQANSKAPKDVFVFGYLPSTSPSPSIKPVKSEVGASPLGFTFKLPEPEKGSEKFSLEAKFGITNSPQQTSVFGSLEPPSEEGEDIKVLKIVSASAEDQQKALKLMLPPNFYLYQSKPPCSGCAGCPEREDSFSMASSNEAVLTGDTKTLSTKVSTSDSTLTKGSPAFTSSGMVFSSCLNSNTSSFKDFISKPSSFTIAENNQWPGQGNNVFGSSPNTEEYHKEEEVDVQFEPVIPLPDLVEVKTGEEDEDLIFSHRCKLFRYCCDSKEWKERGVGDIKVLKKKGDESYRLVMRRDQVLKLVCNQRIHSHFALAPMSKSTNSWTWANVDFSEGEKGSVENLAIKFKTEDIAKKFKEVIESCIASIEEKKP